MAILRAEKTSQNYDDAKVLVVGFIIAMLLFEVPYLYDSHLNRQLCAPVHTIRVAP